MAQIDYKKALMQFDTYVTDHMGDEDLIAGGIAATFISKYHFYRFFKAITGMSVNGYILERRLLQTMEDLQGEESVLSVAIKNGFLSNEVMTRNFKKRFGLTPRAFRRLSQSEQKALYSDHNKGRSLDFTTLDLPLAHTKGSVEAGHKLVDLPETTFLGQSRQSSDLEVLTIPAFVNQVVGALETFEDYEEDAVYRICLGVDNTKDQPTFVEFVGVRVPQGTQVPDGLELLTCQACRVIEFDHRGALYTQEEVPVIKTYELIYKYRLPAMGLVPTDLYYMERYGPDFKGPFDPESTIQIRMTISDDL